MPQTPVDSELLARLKIILRRDLKLGADAPISDELSFFSSDIDLDSLDMLLLVTSVEKEFGVKIPNEAVGRTVFESVSTLARYIQEQPSTPRIDALEKLPHREPFRFVSRITSVREGESAEGVWAVSGKEPFFAGHFPNRPIVPGVLIAEALAQLSGLAGAGAGVAEAGKLAHVDLRFEEAVAPPAEITLKSRLLRSIPPLQQFEVSAELAGRMIARGTLALNRS